MIKEKLLEKIKNALKKFGVDEEKVEIERPTNPNFGDYATSLALKISKRNKKNPFELAQRIVNHLSKDEIIEKIEVVKPGFINFWLSKNFLFFTAKRLANSQWQFPHLHFGKNKKIVVEFADPNTHKLFHIGHLRNITSGESVCRILEAVGNKVIRANYQGDVGLHIAKCLYQIKNLYQRQIGLWGKKSKIKNLKTLKEKIKFLGEAYAKGNQAYETDEKAKKEIIEINKMIYNQDPKILSLWQETRQWSLDYFDQIYKRVGTQFDRFYFESQMAKRGKFLSLEALKKGVLEKSQGAIVFNGKKYGLDTRVFINNLGFPTYEGKELALAEKEFSDFGEIDRCFHVVGPEQTSFFKVTFKVEELLNPHKYKNKQVHLIAGWVRLKYGKMSSRAGKVIEGVWLLDEAKRRIIERYKCEEKIAEVLAVAAVKYSFLKNNINTDIAFDFDESISLEGNSGPYLLYTYVRTQSILKKENKLLEVAFEHPYKNDNSLLATITKEEDDLLRLFSQFEEIVEKAAFNLAPNFIAYYLFDLAQKYNLFYQKYPILKAEEQLKNFRLILTKTTGEIIKKGLCLLGIKTVEKM